MDNSEEKIAAKDEEIETLIKANSDLKRKLEDDWDTYQRLQQDFDSKNTENTNNPSTSR